MKPRLENISEFYGERHQVFLVWLGQRVFGALQKVPGNSWKVFRGSGFSTRFVGYSRCRSSGVSRILHLLILGAFIGVAAAWLIDVPINARESKKLTASWYGERERGRLQANGKPFNPDALTCASRYYKLGTKLRVTYRRGDIFKFVEVEVTDVGPHKRLLKTRQLDLSRSAFLWLSPLDKGLISVTVEVL